MEVKGWVRASTPDSEKKASDHQPSGRSVTEQPLTRQALRAELADWLSEATAAEFTKFSESVVERLQDTVNYSEHEITRALQELQVDIRCLQTDVQLLREAPESELGPAVTAVAMPPPYASFPMPSSPSRGQPPSPDAAMPPQIDPLPGSNVPPSPPPDPEVCNAISSARRNLGSKRIVNNGMVTSNQTVLPYAIPPIEEDHEDIDGSTGLSTFNSGGVEDPAASLVSGRMNAILAAKRAAVNEERPSVRFRQDFGERRTGSANSMDSLAERREELAPESHRSRRSWGTELMSNYSTVRAKEHHSLRMERALSRTTWSTGGGDHSLQKKGSACTLDSEVWRQPSNAHDDGSSEGTSQPRNSSKHRHSDSARKTVSQLAPVLTNLPRSRSQKIALRQTCMAYEIADIPDLGEAPWHKVVRSIITNIVLSTVFDYCMCVVLLLNAVSIAISVDVAARNPGKPDPEILVFAERLFAFIFSVEIILRIYVYTISDFFCGPEWSWNIFDCLVVALQLGEEILFLCMGGRDVETMGQNLSVFRMIRFLKLFRVMRVLRIIRFVQELNNLVFLIHGSLVPFLWTFTLMMLLIFMMGAFCTQLVAAYSVEAEPKLREVLDASFGSLGDSILSLWQAVSGGVDWRDLLTPLMQVTPVMSLVFFAYTAFMVLVMLNLVTGVFVDGATKLRERETKRNAVRHLQKIFNTAQNEQKGIFRRAARIRQSIMHHQRVITEEDFKKALEGPEMRELFQKMNLETTDGEFVFGLLDTSGDGELTIEEFVLGGLRLQGSAKSIDVAKFALRQEKEFRDVKALLARVLRVMEPKKVVDTREREKKQQDS